MKIVTVDSQTAYLLHYTPNWAGGFEAEFSFLTDEERGLTGREERVPLSNTLRTSLGFDLVLQRENAAEFRAALRTLGNNPVLCPFWPAANRYHDTSAFYDAAKTGLLSSGYLLCFEPDLSEYEVYDAALSPAFTPSVDAIKVPVLWGRFSKDLNPEAVTDELLRISVSFTENSGTEKALVAASLSFSDGPTAAGEVRPMFPLRPNFGDLKFGAAVVEIETQDIGYGRETADTYYPQIAVRSTEQQILCKTWADVHALVRFFSDMRGTVNNFWVPSYVGDCRLDGVAAPGSSMLLVDNAEGLGDASHLALISPDTIEPHTVDTIDTDGNTVSFAEATSAAFSPYSTVLSTLLLARFSKASLKISFKTDSVASAAISFVEVPQEYEAAEDDSGAQDAAAWLYKFSLSGYDDWLFTSHESAITHGTDVYAPQQFDHDDISENINLDKNNLTLTSRYFWHDSEVELRNPLGYLYPFRLEAPLYVSVMECTPDDNGNIASFETKFSGQVKSVSAAGPILEAACISIGSIFERQVPTLLMQETCNYALYGSACGLNSDSWKMAASVVSYDGANTLIIGQPSFVDTEAARPATAVFDHYFAGGKMQHGADDTFERRGILDSVALGDNITLTIRYALENTPETIFLWPGCDGQKETCRAYDAADNPTGKFDNYRRFGGFPFIPTGNPSMVSITEDTDGGKK